MTEPNAASETGAPLGECPEWTLGGRLLAPLRLAGTGIAFAVFGLGGCLFRFGITPYLRAKFPGAEHQALRTRLSRRVVQWWFERFVKSIALLQLVHVKFIGLERLSRPGLIIAANHPSLIDVVCLISALPNATTMVKAALLKNWFTAPPIAAADYAVNDEGALALSKIEKDLQDGAAFVIFPEGTRTPSSLPPNEAPRMHRGAAAVALTLGRPITPVRIAASPRWLTKDRAWWRLPPKPMTLVFEVLEDLDSADLRPLYNVKPSRAARILNARLAQALFGLSLPPQQTAVPTERRQTP